MVRLRIYGQAGQRGCKLPKTVRGGAPQLCDLELRTGVYVPLALY